MASTRSSSPAEEDVSAPTSPQLTPRSKIKAMLAAVDEEDSGDDATGPIDTKALFRSIEKNSKPNDESLPTQNEDDDDEEEDDDDDIVRPRGRLAARMHAKCTTNANSASKSPDNAPRRVIDTVERRATSDKGGDDDEDEEDVNALPRRRLARPIRSKTPEATTTADIPSSPGLFVSPDPPRSVASRHSAAGSDDDDDLPVDLGKSERFKALVARKREERLAKEAEEERKREERAQRMAEQMPADSDVDDDDDDDDDDVSDISDDAGGRKLTQDVSRPARKASKKALEEMNRETQRLSRSLQLAHEAKTKKKISKASLFERFNFKTATPPAETKAAASSSRPTTPGSAHQTDLEMGEAGTPPSSPPAVPKSISNLSEAPAAAAVVENLLDDILEVDEKAELPSLEAALTQSKQQDKGKGKAVETVLDFTMAKKPAVTKPKRQVRVKLSPVQANLVTIDSEDELEITQSKKSRMDKIFDRLPAKKAQESNSMNMLKRLAHLSSPSSKEPSRGRNTKPSMTPGELQMSLQQRARAQAKLERERRLELLRSKGVVVQTEEEREREREDVEDMVARARQEVEEIMQRERDAAKKTRKEKKANGEEDPLGWDDSDDDSFEGSDEGEPAAIELSGSEEEGEKEVDDEMVDESGEDAEDEEEPTANTMFEAEVQEDGESEGEQTLPAAMNIASDDETEDLPFTKSRRAKKHGQILSDDEDDVEATPRPKTAHPKSPSAPGSTSSPKIPTSVLRSATKTFIPGLPVPAAGPAGLGLTQIFAGTMDDSQAGPASGSPQEFMPSFDNFPNSQFSATAGQSQNDDIFASQPTQQRNTQGHETQTQGLQLNFLQSQTHGFDSLMQVDGTQMSELIEPTQDVGFQAFSPLKQRFVDPPQSTVDTVVMGDSDNENVQESPLVRKKGKLRRRGQHSLSISSLPPTDIPKSPTAVPTGTSETTIDSTASASAFKLMEKAARKKKRMQDKFNRKKSKALGMVEEQAEESEDEYAGLGGADGEDSSEEDEELAKEMIDDAAGNDIDEGKLAGFFADRERAADAAQVDKLFRDITTGQLRKRRRGDGNNDFDLSDSDDGGEARRRMKRHQFAKMQKALFADERIGKIAENPRNAAFLKSIEDRNSDDEWDFGDNFAEAAPESTEGESQSQAQAAPQREEAIPDSQPKETNVGRKRARMDDPPARPPPNARRTKDGARPASLTDVRRELSSLLEEPNGSFGVIIPATEVGSDSEEEAERVPIPASSSSNKENRGTANKRANVAVVDRISLKRNSSSSLSNPGASTTATSRQAFAAPSVAGSGSFKAPGLLRRATTNSLMSISSTSSLNAGGVATTNNSGTGTLNKAGSFEADGKLKKNAGKRSGVHYFARENERRAKVAEAEKKREAKKWKGAEGRGKAVGGLFGGGRFE